MANVPQLSSNPAWTSTDTKNALLASLVPAATAISAVAALANDRSVVEWWSRSKKPSWAPKNSAVYSVVDIATLSPLGYASYLVYKNGGGFGNVGTKVALGVYGLNMFFAMTTIPIIKKKCFSCLFRNTLLLNMTAVGAAYTFYKVDKNAGLLLVPYAIWTGFYSLLTYSMSVQNPSRK